MAEARSAALVGPKQVDWDDPEQLLEVGLRTTASARRANDVVAGEIDQGQHDDRSDVLAVGTAGALIDRADRALYVSKEKGRNAVSTENEETDG